MDDKHLIVTAVFQAQKIIPLDSGASYKMLNGDSQAHSLAKRYMPVMAKSIASIKTVRASSRVPTGRLRISCGTDAIC